MRKWGSLLRSLGQSLVELIDAEAAALRGDLADSGRRFSMALAIAALAAFLLFWSVGAAAFTLYQVLRLWIPPWGSALVVLGLFLLLSWILALIARRRLRAIEVPSETVRRRIDDHLTWWRGELLLEDEAARADRAIEDETEEIEGI